MKLNVEISFVLVFKTQITQLILLSGIRLNRIRRTQSNTRRADPRYKAHDNSHSKGSNSRKEHETRRFYNLRKHGSNKHFQYDYYLQGWYLLIIIKMLNNPTASFKIYLRYWYGGK